MEDSVQGSWPDGTVGDTVTITCPSTHVLKGNSVLTCSDVEGTGKWDKKPICKMLGKSDFVV